MFAPDIWRFSYNGIHSKRERESAPFMSMLGCVCVCVSVSVVYMCACHVSVCNHVCYCVYVGRKELCHRTTETLIALVLDTCTH